MSRSCEDNINRHTEYKQIERQEEKNGAQCLKISKYPETLKINDTHKSIDLRRSEKHKWYKIINQTHTKTKP